jgi:hypothetical protein
MLSLAMAVLLGPGDAKIVDLKDGFVRVETSSYSLEVPKGWEVSRETAFGQREMTSDTGRMTAMTAAGGGKQGWEQLYRTSLYFIMREKKGNPTPYQISKTKQGYEACSFSILDSDGFADRRYVILKNEVQNILALSVKIPDKKKETGLMAQFDRMVRTAKLL